VYRNGCATSEDMLWKLDALQSFILDLHWPDEVFAEHLSHRLKLMSADMIEAAAKRFVTVMQFVLTAFILPSGPLTSMTDALVPITIIVN